jgi:hypothetical protein
MGGDPVPDPPPPERKTHIRSTRGCQPQGTFPHTRALGRHLHGAASALVLESRGGRRAKQTVHFRYRRSEPHGREELAPLSHARSSLSMPHTRSGSMPNFSTQSCHVSAGACAPGGQADGRRGRGTALSGRRRDSRTTRAAGDVSTGATRRGRDLRAISRWLPGWRRERRPLVDVHRAYLPEAQPLVHRLPHR